MGMVLNDELEERGSLLYSWY